MSKQDVTLSLKITADSKAIKRSYQVCYDVMVAFYMFAHTDSLERERKRKERENIVSLLSTVKEPLSKGTSLSTAAP